MKLRVLLVPFKTNDLHVVFNTIKTYQSQYMCKYPVRLNSKAGNGLCTCVMYVLASLVRVHKHFLSRSVSKCLVWPSYLWETAEYMFLKFGFISTCTRDLATLVWCWLWSTWCSCFSCSEIVGLQCIPLPKPLYRILRELAELVSLVC